MLLTLLAPVPEQSQIPTLWQNSEVRVAVEVAFRSNPLDATLLWEDITDYVNEISITRGRSGELDRFQPSTAAITVSSTSRDFDPEYASGGWYGYVLPNRPIRVRVQYDAGSGLTEYFVWQGFVDEWPQDHTGLAAAQVTIPCSDAFAWLSTIAVNEPFLIEMQNDFANGDVPLSWYRLGESSGATVARDSVGANNGTYLGEPTLGQPAVISGATDTSVLFPYTDPDPGGGIIRVAPSPVTGYPVAFEFMYKAETTTFGSVGEFFALTANYTAGGASPPYLYAKTGSSEIWFRSYDAGNNRLFSAFYPSSVVNDGEPHHLVFVVDSQGRPSFYLDGELIPADPDTYQQTYVAGSSFVAALDELLIGGSYIDGSVWYGCKGDIDEFVIWDIAPTAERIAARAAAALGWAGDTTAQRASRILTRVGWAAIDTDIGTGATTVSDENITGSVYDYLMTLADTEGGQCYVDGQGRIVFRGRSEIGSATRSAVSQAVFGDA